MIATVLSIVGGAVSVAASLLLLARALMLWSTQRRVDVTAREATRRLTGVAHWFSEDVPTMNLIIGLAKDRDVSSLRDEWRRERTYEFADMDANVGIATPCPTCGRSSLFVGTGGHLTCSRMACTEPDVGRAVQVLRSDRELAALHRVVSTATEYYDAEMLRDVQAAIANAERRP